MIDEKELNTLLHTEWNGDPVMVEVFDTLQNALAVVRAAQMLESHNAFCEGTKSYDAIHSSVHARMKDVREALKPFDAKAESEDGK